MAAVVNAENPAAPATRLQVPASFPQVLKLTRAQLQEYLASRRFTVLLTMFFAVGVALTAVVYLYRSSLDGPGGMLSGPLSWYSTIWGTAAVYIVVLSAVFFGGDAIAGEFQNKTGYFLMGLPIRRASVYIGKFLAALATSSCVIAVFFGIVIANGVGYFGMNAFPWQLWLSLGLTALYLLAVLGTTFLFSSLFKTSAYGFVLTAILFLFGFNILQDLVSGVVKTEPWMVISYASSSITQVLSGSVNWGIAGTVSHGVPRTGPPVNIVFYTAGVGEAVVIMVAYFVLTAIVGLVMFEREEFT